ncbi:LacI family DNA-binding transcriptional regulator [Candidatus Cetobacterium colombiensis]|uniref:LacI family DNA-binding transcriptional regulator n=1 Tax=Candidatus Cetobacterium colombiensis TaxID=3073100 RepID=A0ABU4WAC3_9FUSO|nr:LacI family DNA-binding transcriptional regulator [Candidatus Cetobacterium colombiensis]MDX8336095.1 LacI family DNA-binding transcriptional regulator [Candidatus Cetobacterium colombiensis]
MKIDSIKIAELAGVSRSTVSRVLNNHPNVSEKNRKKILNIIDEYNYIPNLNAQTLAGKKNKVIGVFIYEPNMNAQSTTDTAYFMNFTDTVVKEAFLNNHQILVDYLKDSNDEKRIESFFKNGNISSGIFIGFLRENLFLEKMIESDYKVVVVDYASQLKDNAKKTLYINTDDYGGGTSVMEEILKKNNKKVLFFSGDKKKLSGLERERAYVEALKNKNIVINKTLMMESDYSREKAYENMKKILDSNIKFDSIFSSCDNMLFGVIEALKERSIDYKNMEIWGFDNLKYTVPMGLKTVSPMLKDTAKKSIKFLISDITESKVEYTKTKLIKNINEYFEN